MRTGGSASALGVPRLRGLDPAEEGLHVRENVAVRSLGLLGI